MKKIFLTFIISLLTLVGFAQLHQHRNHIGHEHYHIESKIGIGVASALIYDLSEKVFVPGFHVHALKIFNERLGAGVGYEAIAGESFHQNITIFGKLFITDFLSVNIGPGLTLPNKEHNEFALSGHIELVTAFDIWKLHAGPMLGCGVSSNDSHVSLGLHIGWHF